MSIPFCRLTLHFLSFREKSLQKKRGGILESGSFPRRILSWRPICPVGRAQSSPVELTRSGSGFFLETLTKRRISVAEVWTGGANGQPAKKTGIAAEKERGKICSFLAGVLHSREETSKMGREKKTGKRKGGNRRGVCGAFSGTDRRSGI